MCKAQTPPCVFLDRDGTIIYDKHYLSDPEEVELLPAAAEGLALLQGVGCALVVLSNQSGVGRGYFDTRSVDAVNARMAALLQAHGIQLTGVLYCPHSPQEQCYCRKPAPGLALEAARLWNLDRLLRAGHCVSVGDKMSDVRLGQKLGGQGVLVLTGKGKNAVQMPGQTSAPRDALPEHDLCHVSGHTSQRASNQDSERVAPDHIASNLHDAALWILKFWKQNSGQKL